LTGNFDMDMEWAPLTQFRQPGNLDPPPDFADRAVNNLPTLFVALKEQLGLALDAGPGAVTGHRARHAPEPGLADSYKRLTPVERFSRLNRRRPPKTRTMRAGIPV